MRYRTITGEFHIHYPDLPRQGPQPDGDTITFKPDTPSHIRSLERFGPFGPNFNKRGMIGVRFEGIDALETHFKESHQELDLAYKSRDLMLAHLGFEDIEFWDHNPNVVKSVRNNPQKGYIVANGIDGNGRVLAFVYSGQAAHSDGESTFLDEGLIMQSANMAVVTAGLAYAAIYTSLPLDLANVIREQVREVRATGVGIFGQESFDTKKSAPIQGLDELEQMVMWPKLFRRLVSFFSSGHEDLRDFEDWLREDSIHRDDRLLLPTGELGNMHDLVVLDGDTLRLQWNPEEVTILPDNA
jgi:hypothetical protein